MAALYDLVFGIRQGVEDLNFRLQETDVKVDLFLSTLASLQDSLTLDRTRTLQSRNRVRLRKMLHATMG
jgi:hypothetical protein